MTTNKADAAASSLSASHDPAETVGRRDWIDCQDALPPIGKRVEVAHRLDRYGLYDEPSIFGAIEGTLNAEGSWLCSPKTAPPSAEGTMADVNEDVKKLASRIRWDEWRGSFDGRPALWIKKLLKARGCVIQLHRFERADDPGCFHTHPAWAVRIVLWGGYVEELGDGRWRTWWPGRIGLVPPHYEHRIGGLRNGRSSWSIWLRGPKVAPINVRGC